MPIAMTHVLFTALFCLFITTLIAKVKKRKILVNLPKLPGSSWLAGSLLGLLFAENVGDADIAFVDKYGLAFWMKGSLSSDLLYLADPKGIQHVLNTCGYTFHKMTFSLQLLFGPSLLGVEGKVHARQRKIMNPVFSHGAVKEFVPAFFKITQKAGEKWRDIMAEAGRPSPVIDVYAWLSRITLDAVGQAAFNYDFGALDNADNEVTKAYRTLFAGALHKPSTSELAIGALMASLPMWTIPFLRLLPMQDMKQLKNFTSVTNKVAYDIVQREIQALDTGLPAGRDVMSTLVRANRSESPNLRLSNEELLSQMTTIMFAGHDTTASTLTWLIYELSRHPEVQDKLRNEIKSVRKANAATNDKNELGVAEFESMEFTIAVIKETLRFYPIAPHNLRKAGRSEVIPLSEPIKTTSGEEITAIPVQKGQEVFMSYWSYNRIKRIWGEDAEQWNPERFLSNGLPDTLKISLGVYANLATFSSGVHSCIGWRFAVLEMQAVLIALIENFEFSLPPAELDIEIIRYCAPTLVPVVKGQQKQGAQMPLCVSAVN